MSFTIGEKLLCNCVFILQDLDNLAIVIYINKSFNPIFNIAIT